MRFSTKEVNHRLAQCPKHSPTPLLHSDELAEHLGLSRLWLKDERQRMGLGSFKALGGAYAVCRLTEECGKNVTVCCASAGNHGLSVAAGASVFGARAVIVLADTVPVDFENRLKGWGARVLRGGADYDESVHCARELCAENDWHFLADSSWPNYIETPRRVMEGYTVIAEELQQSFVGQDQWPTVVYLQAGVGGLACALGWHIREYWPKQPKLVIVEPVHAECLGISNLRGEVTTVAGPASNMGRLDCKEPSLLALKFLSKEADRFLTVTDEEAQQAAAMLTQLGFPTTPSGAAGLAGALVERAQLKAQRVLVIISEVHQSSAEPSKSSDAQLSPSSRPSNSRSK